MNEVEDWSKMQSEFSDCLSLRIGNIYNTSTLFFLSQACQLAWQFISCCNYTKLIKKKMMVTKLGWNLRWWAENHWVNIFPPKKINVDDLWEKLSFHPSRQRMRPRIFAARLGEKTTILMVLKPVVNGMITTSLNWWVFRICEASTVWNDSSNELR